MNKRALFLDRDGVVNVDYGHVYLRRDFHFVDGIFELLGAAKRAGYLIFIVTNQGGIGRGLYRESDFRSLMSWVNLRFLERGCSIDHVYFCPFHPDHGLGRYKRQSDWRKPRPGMLLQAQKDYCIDMRASILIGDRSTDIAAGRDAGVGTLLQLGGSSDSPDCVVIPSLNVAMSYFAP